VVISVNIPDGTERILEEQAALRGQSVESYAAELIRKGVIGGRTFAEILAPFREQVASSDMSDDPKDAKYVDLAIATKADFLVTRDKDLLDLRNPNRTTRILHNHIALQRGAATHHGFFRLQSRRPI